MQTFLPFSDFEKSASVLDRQRLGKQRVECKQIIRAIEWSGIGFDVAWKNHPATKMWRGHTGQLAVYGEAMCIEWMRRGYQDTLCPYFKDRLGRDMTPPPWLGDERLHSAHRARLLMKSPSWYGQFGWHEVPSDTNWWPVQTERGLEWTSTNLKSPSATASPRSSSRNT